MDGGDFLNAVVDVVWDSLENFSRFRYVAQVQTVPHAVFVQRKPGFTDSEGGQIITT